MSIHVEHIRAAWDMIELNDGFIVGIAPSRGAPGACSIAPGVKHHGQRTLANRARSGIIDIGDKESLNAFAKFHVFTR